MSVCPQDILNLQWFLPHNLEFCQEKKWSGQLPHSSGDRASSLLLSGTQQGTEHKGHTTPTLVLKSMGSELKEKSKTGLSSCLKPTH